MVAWFGLLVAACEGNDGGTVDVQGSPDIAGDASGPGTLEVDGDINGNVTWKAGSTVRLRRYVFVENGTLTIEAGVTVLGDQGSALVITPSGRLVAEGTREAPVVFTSSQPAGSRNAGDWGGVVLLGRAPINVAGGTEKIEGFPATESRTNYGGSDADHDCGILRYVRIEFAGYELAKDNELNGLTMGGCGRRTVVDFVQVHKGADDGVEMFGGTADLRHVLVSQPDDDGLDWDFGWTGRVQFLIVQQNALVGDKGIEADNNKNDNGATPRSMPEIWNATLIGSNADPGTAGKTQSGIHFRRGTAGRLSNVVLAWFADYGIHVDDAATRAQADGGTLFVRHSIFWDNGNDTASLPTKTGLEGYDPTAFFLGASQDNRVADPGLAAPLNLAAPSFVPKPGSPVRTGGGTPPSDGFFDPTATFVGAVGDQDWTAGWTAFPAN